MRLSTLNCTVQVQAEGIDRSLLLSQMWSKWACLNTYAHPWWRCMWRWGLKLSGMSPERRWGLFFPQNLLGELIRLRWFLKPVVTPHMCLFQSVNIQLWQKLVTVSPLSVQSKPGHLGIRHLQTFGSAQQMPGFPCARPWAGPWRNAGEGDLVLALQEIHLTYNKCQDGGECQSCEGQRRGTQANLGFRESYQKAMLVECGRTRQRWPGKEMWGGPAGRATGNVEKVPLCYPSGLDGACGMRQWRPRHALCKQFCEVTRQKPGLSVNGSKEVKANGRSGWGERTREELGEGHGGPGTFSASWRWEGWIQGRVLEARASDPGLGGDWPCAGGREPHVWLAVPVGRPGSEPVGSWFAPSSPLGRWGFWLSGAAEGSC